MPENFDQVASRASKNKKITGMWIAVQRFLNLQSKAIHAAPHIGSAGCKKDTYARGDLDHRRSKTSSTRRSACPSTIPPMRTRYLPAMSISIFSAIEDGWAATAAGSAVIVTGISCGGGGAASRRGSSR